MKSDYFIASDIRKNKNTLMHHGIDGQKWGVKHGPPYPLGSKVSTGSSLRKGARAKTIAKAALEGAALGAVAGGVVGGPVGAALSSAASAVASATNAAWQTRASKQNKIAARNEALSVIDKMGGDFSRSDFKVSSTKKTKDGNNYIIEVTNKEDPEMSMFVKVTRDKKTNKMSVSNIGLTEEDAKRGTVANNAEKIKAKSDSYDTKPATKDSTRSSSTKSKKSSTDSSWKYEDSNNEAKLKDSTLKSVQNKVNKYAQSTKWGNNDNIKFASARVVDETNGRKTYAFSYGNGYALFTVYGYMDKNGNIVLNKDNNGKLAVEIFD